MWGNLLLDTSSQYNYNFGFSTYKSDVLLHLAQWQYWWWFWFSLLWVFYFYIIYFVISHRTTTFNPILNSSLRSHGKWGDFLVCLIPLSWCGNILLNSNFILRMLEWQSEGSLFVVRVQGKQWYWVYKFDSTLYQNLLAAPRNIGNNNWVVNTPTGVASFNNYYQAAQLSAQLEFQAVQFESIKKINLSAHDKLSNTLYEIPTTYNSNLAPTPNFPKTQRHIYYLSQNLSKMLSTCTRNKQGAYQQTLLTHKNRIKIKADYLFTLNSFFRNNLVKELMSSKKYRWQSSDKSNSINLELSDTLRYNSGSYPLRILKGILLNNLGSSKWRTLNQLTLLVPKFNSNAGHLVEKVNHLETYWGFRQKKYTRRDEKKFYYKPRVVYSPITLEAKGFVGATHKYKYFYNNNVLSKNATNLITVNLLEHKAASQRNLTVKTKLSIVNKHSVFDYSNSIRINRLRTDSIPTTLSKRLLRVRRTLVLPAHTNITVITNSYDVVHSWFIPGLGIKLDCVPGRSTHHTFYIDNVGFYYGQCAEICGRYHHHMPIRVCALPYEHFVLWWQTRGLPRMRRLKTNTGSVYATKLVQL